MQYLTPSEKEKLLRAVYSETGKHRKRNIAIFEVGLYCALRVSEIKGLKVACYHLYSRSAGKVYSGSGREYQLS